MQYHCNSFLKWTIGPIKEISVVHSRQQVPLLITSLWLRHYTP